MTVSALRAVLPYGYGAILLEVVILCLMTAFVSFPIGGARRKLFTDAFFKKNFPQLKPPYPQGGYPDTGSGLFSHKLSYEEWLHFNNCQRAHLNFLEQFPVAILLLLIAGLSYTRLAAIAGALYIVGRFLYAYYYVTVGPHARTRGSAVYYIGLIILLVLSVMTSFDLLGGVAGTLDFALSLFKF